VAPRRASEARTEADRSFERLYLGHRGDVFRAALRELGNVHDAEDVTQAAFIDAYRAVLRGSRPESPRAWLLAIAENVRRRRVRTALRRPREEPLDPEVASAAEPTTEQTNALRSALAALPPQQRDVFLLREIAGFSYSEIAEYIGSTVGAVQMLLFRARQALRAELEPPPVARRSRGIVVPLPGWLTGLAARSDPLVLTPRAAGALGAAVLAATGVTAELADSSPDARPPQVSHTSAPASPSLGQRRVEAAAEVARPVAAPTRGAPRPRAQGLAAVPDAPPLSPPPVALAPAAAPAPERQAPASQAPAIPVAVAMPPFKVPVTPVSRIAKAVPTPGGVPVPLPPLLEEAGAAAVAGADGPPLPALPLETLPPVP